MRLQNRNSVPFLQENPNQKDARRLLQQITEIEFQSEKVGPVLKTAYKKPVTLEFRDAGLKSIFEIMSRTAGINVVFDKDVRQDTKTSIFVRDTNVEDVFKLLLMTNQLTHKVLNENSVLIYPNTPAKQKEYQELAVRSFYVVNTDVKQIVAMVKGIGQNQGYARRRKVESFCHERYARGDPPGRAAGCSERSGRSRSHAGSRGAGNQARSSA